MKCLAKTILLVSIIALLYGSAYAGGFGSCKGRRAYWNSMTTPWHGGYYDPAWGMPVALVVPPTAENQTKWGWGVGNTRVVSIDHQFQRNYPGPGYYNRAFFRPTPPWPSDTDQFGVYYIRGPWR
ncbi:MAG: hypothetical protein JXB10_16200 [Pirellulales bacterium]|nr:hypothetical protein [Pirellulales bacterium]